MSDRVTVTTTRSWGSRMGNAFKGILFGIIMVGVSFPLLWWNEGRTLERYKALNEGAALVVSVASSEVDPARDGTLVHTTGTASTGETLLDPLFGIAAAQALSLRREVEMFQWHERQESRTEKSLGGSETTTTTYSYTRDWSSRHINSSNFHKTQGHENPTTMAITSHTVTAQDIHLGAFRLSPSQISTISNFHPMPLHGEAFESLGREHHVLGDRLFLGSDPQAPQIGDFRVQFRMMPATEVSIVGQQQGDCFTAYLPQAGGSILLINQGNRSAEAMFKSAQHTNRLISWALRLGGFLLMFVGFIIILKPLSIMAGVVPFIGSVVAFGTGAVAFIMAMPLTLLTIAMAWIFYRPVLAIFILAVAVLSVVVPVVMKRKGTVGQAQPDQGVQ